MNRETEALRVRCSIFRGQIDAVDRYLSVTARLVLLENVEDVQTKIRLVRRIRPPTPSNAGALNSIVRHTVTILSPEHPSSGLSARTGSDS